jgi:uncharacterized protein (DUF1800 family)
MDSLASLPDTSDASLLDDLSNPEQTSKTGVDPDPFLAKLAASTLPMVLAGCGGGTGSSSSPPPVQGPVVVKPQNDADAARFLLQAQFSASDDEITALKSQGYEPWLNAQMDKAVSGTGTAWLAARGYDKVTKEGYYNNYYPGIQMIWQQMLGTNDPVRKRLSFALSEFFVVGFYGLDFSWRSQAIAHHWDQLNKNAFGNFRTLLEDITLNAAMGFFLSTRGNEKENAATGRRPDENYAREVMQLFTIGLNQLNNDGTAKLDSAGKTIPTFTQDDVTNLARVFTGFDWDSTGNVETPDPNGGNYTIQSDSFTRLPMTQDPKKWRYPRNNSTHSTLAATFLGATIAANTDGTVALKTALDTLFNHANVGPFFASQMIKRLVTSNPSAAYVQRVASKFNDNGSGTRGDLRTVFKAILLDDEARGPAGLSSQTFGKVREPAVRLTQWARTFSATSPSNEWKVGDQGDPSYTIGQQPLASPSVFNFFRPGYVPAGTAIAANNLVAPEFQLVNEVSVTSYINAMDSIIQKGINNTDIKADYSKEIAVAGDAAVLTNRLVLLLTANQISDTNRTLIQGAIDAIKLDGINDAAIKLRRVTVGILLVMASSQYLVQK